LFELRERHFVAMRELIEVALESSSRRLDFSQQRIVLELQHSSSADLLLEFAHALS